MYTTLFLHLLLIGNYLQLQINNHEFIKLNVLHIGKDKFCIIILKQILMKPVKK